MGRARGFIQPRLKPPDFGGRADKNRRNQQVAGHINFVVANLDGLW